MLNTTIPVSLWGRRADTTKQIPCCTAPTLQTLWTRTILVFFLSLVFSHWKGVVSLSPSLLSESAKLVPFWGGFSAGCVERLLWSTDFCTVVTSSITNCLSSWCHPFLVQSHALHAQDASHKICKKSYERNLGSETAASEPMFPALTCIPAAPSATTCCATCALCAAG